MPTRPEGSDVNLVPALIPSSILDTNPIPVSSLDLAGISERELELVVTTTEARNRMDESRKSAVREIMAGIPIGILLDTLMKIGQGSSSDSIRRASSAQRALGEYVLNSVRGLLESTAVTGAYALGGAVGAAVKGE